MNRDLLLYLLSLALVTSCTDPPSSPAAAPVSVPAPTPENYSLYTDTDLKIYANTLDLRIQQALKNNDTNQAQELARRRQDLIAEFNRRGLKRKPTEPAKPTRHSHHLHHPGAGLPGQN